MSNNVSTLINIDEYKKFLKFQGLSDEEINLKVNALSEQQSFLISSPVSTSNNISNNEDKQLMPKFAKLKEMFLPLFSNKFTKDVVDGNTIINKTIVTGLVSREFLTSDKYQTFVEKAQSLAEHYNVEMKVSSKSLEDGDFENIISAKGLPANVSQFTQEFKELSNKNNLSLAGLSEQINKPIVIGDAFIPQTESLDFATMQEVTELENEPTLEELSENVLDSMSVIKDDYEKKFGWVMLNSSTIDYPYHYDKSNRFKFAKAEKGYKEIAKEISKEMRNMEIVKDNILNSFSANAINKVLEATRKHKPGTSYVDIVTAFKNNDYLEIHKTPELEEFIKNREKIEADMVRNESLIANNRNRLQYLTQALTSMHILSRTVSDKDAAASKKINWEISLDLPVSVFSKAVSFITPGRYYKNKLEREISNLSFTDKHNFFDIKDKFLNLNKDFKHLTPSEKMIKDDQFSSLNDLRNLVNEKTVVIKSEVNEHIKKMKSFNIDEIKQDVEDYLVLSHKIHDLTEDEAKKIVLLKNKFESILIEDELFFEREKETFEQLKDMCRAYNKVLNPIDYNDSPKKMRIKMKENEVRLSGLSEISKKVVNNGALGFIQENLAEIDRETALLMAHIKEALKPEIANKVRDFGLEDEVKMAKNEILTISKSYETLEFVNEYIKLKNMIVDGFHKAQGVGDYEPENTDERKKELDNVYSRIKKVLDSKDTSYDPKYLKGLYNKMESLMVSDKIGLSIDEIENIEYKVTQSLKKMEWMLTKNPEIQKNIRHLNLDITESLATHASKDNMLISLRANLKSVDKLRTLKPIDTNGFEKIKPAFAERLNFENMRVIEQEKMHTVKYVKPVKAKKMETALKTKLTDIIDNHNSLDDSLDTSLDGSLSNDILPVDLDMEIANANNQNKDDLLDGIFPSSDDIEVGNGQQNIPERTRTMKKGLSSISRNPKLG